MAKTFTAIAGLVGTALLGACTAQAEPSTFPDISGYTPVSIADYRIDTTTPGIPSTRVYFRTPDGIPCPFISGTAGCTGDNLPAIRDEDKSPYTYIDTAIGIQRAGSTPYVSNTIRGQQIKTLPPLHSISVDGVICGVDDKGTTACKDSEGRGFVLSPSWSGWLPKV